MRFTRRAIAVAIRAWTGLPEPFKKFRETRETWEGAIPLYGVKIGNRHHKTRSESRSKSKLTNQDIQTEFFMSASDPNGPFNFNNWLNHDGDGGTNTKDNFEIAQNNRIHSPDDSNKDSVTLVGATIVGPHAAKRGTSAAYHLFPKHDPAYEMVRGGPNRIKPALETSDTVH